MVYEKLSDSELDQLLLISYLPNRVDKINFSDKETFISMIVSRIKSMDISEEFGENILLMAKRTSQLERPESNSLSIVSIFCLDMKYIKMAALKTFHDNSEFIKK